MVFWGITLGVLALVLLIAWRHDRKHGRRYVSNRVAAVEIDRARAAEGAMTHRGAGGGHSGFPLP